MYALKCALVEARITKDDYWMLHVDNEASAVKSVNSLAFVVMMGGDVMTSLPYLHNYIAENTVQRHSRVIWAICYESGIGISGWDSVTETWWMFNPMEITTLTGRNPV